MLRLYRTSSNPLRIVSQRKGSKIVPENFRGSGCAERVRSPQLKLSNNLYHRHHSSFSRASSNDVARAGKWFLGSSLIIGLGFAAFEASRAFGLAPLTLGLDPHPSLITSKSTSIREDADGADLGLHLLAVSDALGKDSRSGSSGGSSESSEAPYASQEGIKQAIEELRKALPDARQVETDPNLLQIYGSSSNSYHPTSPHSVVVRAKSTEDVVKIVHISRKYRIPITAYSGATSLEGHFSGFPSGDICLDMSGMDKILEINEGDGDLVCQAGARWEDINRTLKEKGVPLFFPLDPGPGATIGGMIATGCSGTNAVRYGTAKAEWFLNVTVVLPSGKVIKTRRRARKSSAGFDTTKLFIGAEGTLGIVTEATLRLAPLIPYKVAMAQFPNVEKAVSAVQEILNTPYGPHIQCVELLDDHMMDAINSAGVVDNTYPVKDTLFFKIQGAQASVKETSDLVQEIVKKHGSSHFEFASTDEEAENLWESRKYALHSTISANPGYHCWTTDVCVPVSRLPELVYETKRDLADAKLKSTIVGHVGDGNFHALILFRENNNEELERVSDAVHRLVYRAISLDGTCTGEHGVGIGKNEYLVDELGENTVELMVAIKQTIDPLNLFNPGKLYPKGLKSGTTDSKK